MMPSPHFLVVQKYKQTLSAFSFSYFWAQKFCVLVSSYWHRAPKGKPRRELQLPPFWKTRVENLDMWQPHPIEPLCAVTANQAILQCERDSMRIKAMRIENNQMCIGTAFSMKRPLESGAENSTVNKAMKNAFLPSTLPTISFVSFSLCLSLFHLI